MFRSSGITLSLRKLQNCPVITKYEDAYKIQLMRLQAITIPTVYSFNNIEG